jgi:predicted acetyltransferase
MGASARIGYWTWAFFLAPPMNLEIKPASDDDYAIVANLARFYIYDMAEHAGWEFPASGAFDAEDQFAPYWGKPRRRPWPEQWKGFPFVVRVDTHLAGFALVKQIAAQPATFDMGEFFIARQHRRKGVGQRVATAMFDRFPGHWQVREMLTNKAAQAFWRRVIADYTAGAFTDSQEAFADQRGEQFVVQRFRSRTTPV